MDRAPNSAFLIDVEEFRFSLDISEDDYLAHYTGSIKSVLVTTYDGKRVQFPAIKLRPFVTRSGISGKFVLIVDKTRSTSELRRA